MLDVRSCRIVIVGGGAVGARKAAGLLEAGASDVVVISLAFDPKVPAGVTRTAARFEPSQLDGARLVFAATDSAAVNAAVVAAARERNLFVSRADGDDGPLRGDVSGMSVHRDGALTLAVAAAGNPVIAGRVRDQLAQSLPQKWVELARVAAQWRPGILRSGAAADRRTAALRLLADEHSADLLAERGIDALRTIIREQLGSQW